MKSQDSNKTAETTDPFIFDEKNKRKPLSQASGKKKLLIAVPVALICGALAIAGVLEEITRFLAIVLSAYAIVGAIEIFGGESLLVIAKNWDTQSSWKKFLISFLVIMVTMVGFISLIPVLAS